MTTLQLNLGCNRKKLAGFVNIDIDCRYNPDIVTDISTGLPFPDNSVDLIRAYDVLEHTDPSRTIPMIEDFWRVLVPGGMLDTSTPDAEFGQGAFMDPTHRNFWTEGRWLYFSHPAYRAIYNIQADFEIIRMERHMTDTINRVYHLRVVAKANKTSNHDKERSCLTT